MNRNVIKATSLVIFLIFFSIILLEFDAFARAGGGRSFGSRGSRNYSVPSRSFLTPAPSRQQAPSAPMQSAPQQQPRGGGFLRSFGGGLLGGFVGGMLFRSLGFGGFGGGLSGSGLGIFEILLILVIGYFIYKMIFKRRSDGDPPYQAAYRQEGYRTGVPSSYDNTASLNKEETSVPEGLSHIRQMDPYFDEGPFKDNAMDIFFKIQGAWMNRNLAPVNSLLTENVKNILQQDIDKLLSEKKINRMENIAIRNVEIAETWQESGQDFITVLLYANLLDYTIGELTGEVTAGSKTEPVKFEEFWTFTRPVGNNPWKLSAISQA